jgi:hypothetical protein
MNIYLVWARADEGGERSVLAAYADERDATMHVQRALRVEYDSNGDPRASAAELLGVHVWQEAFAVKPGRDE